MLPKNLFKRPNNRLEGSARAAQPRVVVDTPEEVQVACPACKAAYTSAEVEKHLHVCPGCRHHFRISARRRLAMLLDEGSFVEHDRELLSKNLIDFPNYEKKLNQSRLESSEREAVVCGHGQICGCPCALFVMEPSFMMGSMGTVVGEKITRLFEYATEQKLPVVGFTVSGGARMQEGILSLMQMAKTSGAVGRHSDAGLLYIAVLTDPTTGGVTASFAMEADIILAEPRALIGFAGPRVIEQTIRQKLPPGFQRAEFLLERGFVDEIVDRRRQRKYLRRLLGLHTEGGAQ